MCSPNSFSDEWDFHCCSFTSDADSGFCIDLVLLPWILTEYSCFLSNFLFELGQYLAGHLISSFRPTPKPPRKHTGQMGPLLYDIIVMVL